MSTVIMLTDQQCVSSAASRFACTRSIVVTNAVMNCIHLWLQPMDGLISVIKFFRSCLY